MTTFAIFSKTKSQNFSSEIVEIVLVIYPPCGRPVGCIMKVYWRKFFLNDLWFSAENGLNGLEFLSELYFSEFANLVAILFGDTFSRTNGPMTTCTNMPCKCGSPMKTSIFRAVSDANHLCLYSLSRKHRWLHHSRLGKSRSSWDFHTCMAWDMRNRGQWTVIVRKSAAKKNGGRIGKFIEI